MDPYKTHDVYFDFKHSQFQKSLMGKHHNIKDKRIILFMKHLYLKNIVNGFQISIIVASTIITFFESMKPHIFKNESDKKTQILSICLSTYIAIFTAVYKFLKIDDRKEEIYKMLQIFNEVESTINEKVKELNLIQSSFEDEITFFNKNSMICCNVQNDISNENTHYNNEDYCDDDSENSDDNISNITNKVIDTTNIFLKDNKELCEERRKIVQKYFKKFNELMIAYNNEETEKKIIDAKKQFHTMFSYNEIIYYKGKIVESMLLEKVHAGNRSILEAPLEDYKNHYKMMDIYKNENDYENVSRKIKDTKQIYNEDELLYGTSWMNNLCLYFSNMCHFCLVMNLYLSLAIKRSKFRILKRKYSQDQDENSLEFKCCRCKYLDQCIEHCFKSKNENEEVENKQEDNAIYCCCEC